MKKTSILFTTMVLATIFYFSCSYRFNFDYDKMKDRVEKIKIISVERAIIEVSWNSTLKEIDYKVLKTLDGDEMDKLLFDLSKINYIRGHPLYRRIRGLNLKIYYKDSNYGFINHNTWLTFNERNITVGGTNVTSDEEVFFDLVSDFIDCSSNCSVAYYFDYFKMIRDVERIEIINIDGADVTVLEVLDNDRGTLLSRLEKVRFTRFVGGTWNDNPQGLTIKIYHRNSDYSFINHNTSTRFNKDNEFVSGFQILYPEEDFKAFIYRFCLQTFRSCGGAVDLPIVSG
ncbi:MAG: hypothetical protein LBU83_00710 [Bacteroidales bacterium]|jgi:hypothetical protein|nr:hypothetical protein [Bacteroidales bacterium]